MFLFNQFHVLNSLTDELSGKNKLQTVTGGLHILRINKFLKDNVCAIYKREHSAPVLGNITIPMVNDGAGYYRVKFYVRLSGSQNTYYANDFVLKGKPFAYEFKVKAADSAADMAQSAVDIINKMQNFYGDKWIKAEVSGNNLVINATTEYQLFTEGSLQKLDQSANTPLTNEIYRDVEASVPTVVKSVEGFGTYNQLTKDIKLPTLEHRAFEAHDQEQLPIPGATYDQYIISYKVDRGHFGGAAVGQLVTSKVEHIFYVKSDLSAQFETALAAIEPTAGIEVITKPAAQAPAAPQGNYGGAPIRIGGDNNA